MYVVNQESSCDALILFVLFLSLGSNALIKRKTDIPFLFFFS